VQDRQQQLPRRQEGHRYPAGSVRGPKGGDGSLSQSWQPVTCRLCSSGGDGHRL